MRNSILQLTILCFLALGIQARSEQFQIQFEASISEIKGDPSALNLPFSLNLGQQITGQYTFQSKQESLDIFLHRELGKQGQLTLTIDDISIDAATNFGSLNSVAVLDPPISGPTSSVFLDYVSPTDVFPGWPGSVAGQLWSHQLILVGLDGTIGTPEQLLDVGNWNQLTLLRRLDLRFGFPNTISIQAIVGDVTAVPEPSRVVLTIAMLFAGSSFFMLRKLRDQRVFTP